VAERLSLISDALFLEATAIQGAHRSRGSGLAELDVSDTLTDVERPAVPPKEQARAIAEWIYAGRAGAQHSEEDTFPGLGWLRQPDSYSDREWIIEIARQYRALLQ
jgi:hypothetical protein